MTGGPGGAPLVPGTWLPPLCRLLGLGSYHAVRPCRSLAASMVAMGASCCKHPCTLVRKAALIAEPDGLWLETVLSLMACGFVGHLPHVRRLSEV